MSHRTAVAATLQLQCRYNSAATPYGQLLLLQGLAEHTTNRLFCSKVSPEQAAAMQNCVVDRQRLPCLLLMQMHLFAALFYCCKLRVQVLLFSPQGTSCDFVSQVPGQLPAAASKVQQASDTDAGIFINGPMPTAGVSSSVSAAARGQPAQAAAAAAARQEPSAQEQYMRMVLRQQRRHGDAAEQAAAREEIVRRGFTNARSVKVDHAAVFIARVGEGKDPRGVVQVEQDGVEHR